MLLVIMYHPSQNFTFVFCVGSQKGNEGDSTAPVRQYLSCNLCSKQYLTMKGLVNHKSAVHTGNIIFE